MGVDFSGVLLFRDVPGQFQGHAAADLHLAIPMAAVPDHVRRRTDQNARGPVLAGPDMPQLLLRNPADAQSFELVLSLGPSMAEQGRGTVQSLFGTDCAVLLFSAAALCGNCGRDNDCLPIDDHRQRQSVLAELADAHPGILNFGQEISWTLGENSSNCMCRHTHFSLRMLELPLSLS